MALIPIPYTTDGSGPAGAIPLTVSGPTEGPPLSPVLQALADVGFGQSGQVLQMNSTEDGFEWVILPSGT